MPSKREISQHHGSQIGHQTGVVHAGKPTSTENAKPTHRLALSPRTDLLNPTCSEACDGSRAALYRHGKRKFLGHSRSDQQPGDRGSALGSLSPRDHCHLPPSRCDPPATDSGGGRERERQATLASGSRKNVHLANPTS
jgi:hypothetical protein